MTFLQASKRAASPHPMTIGGIRPVIWISIKSIGDYAPLSGSNVNTANNKAGTGGSQGSDAGPQGDGEKQPDVVTEPNGKAVMSFSGLDELPITYTYGSEATWFIVAEETGNPEYIISGNSMASHPSFITGFGGGPEPFQFIVQTGAIPFINAHVERLPAAGSPSTGLHVLATTWKDESPRAEIRGYFDGNEEYDKVTTQVIVLAGNTFNTLGGTTIGPIYTGRLPELVVYDKALPAVDILRLSQYLKNEWATP